jgi:serine/threonine-protein kinase
MAPARPGNLLREGKRCPTCGQGFSGDAAFCPFDGARLAEATFDPLGDPLVGTVVDNRYRVLEVLAEGGMGRVYKVAHTSLERCFAMKVLRDDLARDPHLAERFIHEAKATASVKHHNVVQITDFGSLPSAAPYFVMELLTGRTLGRLLKAGPVPVTSTIAIIRQVALGLGAAHQAGVIHRDLKPDNVVLVEGDGSREGALEAFSVDVRVVDFGAAKIVGSHRITRAGVVFGTPHYMSPEQASGQPVDRRADVYALGVIMYEMFTGRVPFEGDTYMGVLTQHMFVLPVPPSQVNPLARDLGALEDVTLACLAKRPGDRFASMTDLVDTLDEVGRGGAARVAARLKGYGRGVDSKATADAPTRADARSDPPGRPRGGGRNWAWAALAGAAPVLLTMAWWLVTGRDRHRVAEQAAVAPSAGPQADTAGPGPVRAAALAAPVLASDGTSPASPERGRDLTEVTAQPPPQSAPAAAVPARGRAQSAPTVSHAPAPREAPALDEVGDPFAPRN